MKLECLGASLSSDPGWIRSRFSTDNNCCVEARYIPRGLVALRDSKYRRTNEGRAGDEPIIIIPATEWSTFLIDLKSGRSPDRLGRLVEVVATDCGEVDFRACDGTTLRYFKEEWDAFVVGVLNDEFGIPRLKAYSLLAA